MIDAVYRAESRRVLATLIRLLGGFELAEEALHEAFAAAVDHRGFRRRRALGHHTCSPLRMGAEQALVEHEFDRGRPPAFPRHYEPRLQEPERHTDSWVKSA